MALSRPLFITRSVFDFITALVLRMRRLVQPKGGDLIHGPPNLVTANRLAFPSSLRMPSAHEVCRRAERG